MSVFYQPNQELVETDLKIYIKNNSGVLVDVDDIRYSIYQYNSNDCDWILLPDHYRQDPVRHTTGHYYVSWEIPGSQGLGRYQIRWDYRNGSDPYRQTRLDFTIGRIKIGTPRTATVEDLGGTSFVIY